MIDQLSIWLYIRFIYNKEKKYCLYSAIINMNPQIQEIKKKISPILKEKGAIKVLLFGSLARGTSDSKSDIDLIIIDNENLSYIKRLDKYFDDLSKALMTPLDIFVYNPEEFKDMQEGPFVKKAVKEGIVLYEH